MQIGLSAIKSSDNKMLDQQTFQIIDIITLIWKGLSMFTLLLASAENSGYVRDQLEQCTSHSRPIDCPTYEALELFMLGMEGMEEYPEEWFADFATINAVNLNLGPMYNSFKAIGAGGPAMDATEGAN